MAAESDTTTLLARAFTGAVDGGDEVDPTRREILDAAYRVFCHLGVERARMEDVAQAAGVSRITVYRRFETKDALVQQVVRREFRAYFEQFVQDVAGAATIEDRVVAGFLSSLRSIRGNPLIHALIAAGPDAYVPSMIDDGGATLATVRYFLADRLRREQSAGNLDPGLDVDVAAEMVARTCASFLVLPSDLLDVDDEEHMTVVARQFLLPMLRLPRASA